MNNTEVLAHLSTPFTFRRRPVAVVPDFRASWRISVLLLILAKASWGKRSSIRRLHVINWAVRSPSNWETLARAMAGQMRPAEILVRFEPTLNRAIDFAIGLGLVERIKGDRIRITAEGLRAVDHIQNEEGLFSEESKRLKELGTGLTEGLTDELLGRIWK